jgi:hypothetical protein
MAGGLDDLRRYLLLVAFSFIGTQAGSAFEQSMNVRASRAPIRPAPNFAASPAIDYAAMRRETS